MDTIYIQEFKIETVIGCLAWERQVKQPVIFDLAIDIDAKKSGQLDDLSKTVDYCAIGNTLRQFVEQSECKLLETLAEQSAALLLEKFSIAKIKVSVSKAGAIKNAKAVKVSIERP